MLSLFITFKVMKYLMKTAIDAKDEIERRDNNEKGGEYVF